MLGAAMIPRPNGMSPTLRSNIERSKFKTEHKRDSSSMSDMEPARDEVKGFEPQSPDEYRDGARCAFLRRFDGVRQEGGYPPGFHHWPLERRNAWFAGFNRGYHDRLDLLRGEAAQ
jgi:hypothetical protein